MPGFQPDIFQIVAIRDSSKIPIEFRKTVTAQRKPLPLTPAYAFIEYRSQGQSITYVIIEITAPPSEGLTPLKAYVALSRNVSRTNASLFWNFQDIFFKMAPNENLANKDTSLVKLAAAK